MKTRAEYLKEYGLHYLIEKKVEKGELFKVGKGIYSEKICSWNSKISQQKNTCVSFSQQNTSIFPYTTL